MVLNSKLLELLSKKIGQDVTTPAGATVLMLDIETTTRAKLGLNTVKRLVGVLDDEGAVPRRSTLNAVANFLGYPDWLMLEKDSVGKGSRFIRENPFINMENLAPGTKVEICWNPDRRIVIRHQGIGQYVVIESENCKLEPGDLLSLGNLAMGYPFFAYKVFRNEKPLGCYQAVKDSCILRFNILEERITARLLPKRRVPKSKSMKVATEQTDIVAKEQGDKDVKEQGDKGGSVEADI